MPAIRTFTAPVAQTPFAAASLESVKIDMATRQVTGFVSWLDAQGNALRSDPYAIDFSKLAPAVQQAGAAFIEAILSNTGLPAGTDVVG